MVPVIKKAPVSPVSTFILSDHGPSSSELKAMAASAPVKGGMRRPIPTAAPKSPACIRAKRITVRFKSGDHHSQQRQGGLPVTNRSYRCPLKKGESACSPRKLNIHYIQLPAISAKLWGYKHSLFENHRPVAHLLRLSAPWLMTSMLRPSSAAYGSQDVREAVPGRRIEICGRLIQQQQPWFPDYGPGNSHPLLLSTGKLLQSADASSLSPRSSRVSHTTLLSSAGTFKAGKACPPLTQQDSILHWNRQPSIRPSLGNIADLPPHPLPGVASVHSPPENLYLTPVGMDKTHDHLKQSRLTGPVFPLRRHSTQLQPVQNPRA